MFRCSRVQLMLALGIAVLALGTVLVPQAAAQQSTWKPLNVVGWNTYGITDTNPSTRFTQYLDDGCCALFQTGAVDSAGVEHDDGVPSGSDFQSLTGSGVTYLLQPSINANVLQVGSAGNTIHSTNPESGYGALVLVEPAPYSQIAIIAFGGNAGGCPSPCLLNVTINYTDGSGLTAQYHSEDWCSSNLTAAQQMALSAIPPNPSMNALLPNGAPVTSVGRTSGGLSAKGTDGFTYGNGCTNSDGTGGFEAYETIIATDNTRTIQSIVFNNPATSGVDFSNILAVSGTP
jgi:hypothetical protein